jgi:hypothetical protein
VVAKFFWISSIDLSLVKQTMAQALALSRCSGKDEHRCVAQAPSSDQKPPGNSQQMTQIVLGSSNAPFAAQPLCCANASLAPTALGNPFSLLALCGVVVGTIGFSDFLHRLFPTLISA